MYLTGFYSFLSSRDNWRTWPGAVRSEREDGPVLQQPDQGRHGAGHGSHLEIHRVRFAAVRVGPEHGGHNQRLGDVSF